MTLRFDEPAWFWAFGALALWLLSWWWLDRLPAPRRAATLLLRILAFAALVTALARPELHSKQTSIAVVGVLDVSGSIDRFAETPPSTLLESFLSAAKEKDAEDRVGVVAFDGRARAVMTPTSMPRPLDTLETAVHEGTALADGVSLARALIPAGEAGRVVVISDGLETIGRAAAVAESDAPGRVAIDVVLVPLRDVDDVSIDTFDLPATALPRSLVSTLVTLRATAPTNGILRFRADGRSLELRGDAAEGDGLRVELGGGTTTVRAQLPVGDGPVHQLEAIFEADDAAGDRIPENSRAKRVIAVPAGRSVLALGSSADPKAADRLLEAAGFDVRRMPADALPEDPLWLAGFDLILLDDVPAALLPPWSQQLIADHVQRLGGGLLCTGGPDTFGPGGWRGSTLASLLPIDVEPPTERRRPRSAVVFVIDRSGSMRQNVGGARASQQEVANEAAAMAIESIASRAYVGVIAFENRPSTIVPIAPLDDPAAAAERVRNIGSDGGTAIGAALGAALDALDTVSDVDQKLVVLLTDGMGRDEDVVLAQTERAAAAKVVVTTIAIGDNADDALLLDVATRTSGTFHPVRNPRLLPRVLVESVQLVNRPLIREGVITIRALGDSDLARTLRSAPALGGVVVMGRPRSAETLLDAESGEGEPLLARWPAGIGRVAVFASEFGGPWTANWESWPGAAALWEQLARWCARSPGSAPVAAEARIEDGRFTVVLEAAAADAIAGAVVDGIARSPSGERRPFLLHRTAPRRFVGTIDADESGPWLAVLSPSGAAGPLPPLLAAAVAPEGAEYERHDADAAPLEALRRATGGRVIPAEALASTDLFTREALRLGRRERLLAPELLALAALLFLGDVALRRLAVRKRMLVEAVSVVRSDAALAGELSARRRGAAAAVTTGASAAAAADGEGLEPRDRRAARDAPATNVSGTARATAAPADAVGASRAPSAEEVRRALAELRGRRGDQATAGDVDAASTVPSESTSDRDSGAVDADDKGGDTTLDALRRARERSRIFPP